jgi:hypothetical protein
MFCLYYSYLPFSIELIRKAEEEIIELPNNMVVHPETAVQPLQFATNERLAILHRPAAITTTN